MYSMDNMRYTMVQNQMPFFFSISALITEEFIELMWAKSK